jgi:integrase
MSRTGSSAPRLFAPERPPVKNDGVTVRELFRLYLRHCEADNTHCPEARAERQATFALFEAVHGDLPAEECEPYHLEEWIDEHPRWKSISTRRAKANQIRAAFKWAADKRRIKNRPFEGVRYREAERRPDMPDPTLDQVAALANKRYERALRFLRVTACRLSEMCELAWSDKGLDLQRGIWKIERHKSRRATGKAKLVALVPEAVELLRLIRSEQGAAYQGTVFLNNRGTAWNRRTLGQHLRRMKVRHKIDTPASLHGIRHRFGTTAVANKAAIKLLSAQMGHSTVAVTERYYVDLGEGEIDAVRDAARLGLPPKKGQMTFWPQ